MHEENCGICSEQFHRDSEATKLMELGPLCPTCIGMLGRRDPEKFLTLEEFEAALQRYPAPVFATDEELHRQEDAVYREFGPDYCYDYYEATAIPRSELE